MLERNDHCLNCGTELPEKEAFCPNCGQKNANLQLSSWALIQEMLGSLFNYDNRFWRTIPVFLFQPGNLTNAFVDGKRIRYVHPFRLYLLSSILFFFTFRSFYFTGDEGIIPENLPDSKQMADSLQAKYSSQEVQDVLDSVQVVLKDSALQNGIYYQGEGLEYLDEEVQKGMNWEFDLDSLVEERDEQESHWVRAYKLAKTQPYLSDQAFLDSMNLPVEEDPEVYLKEYHIVRDGGQSFINLMVENFSWAILFLVPVYALLLKLFYRKRLYFTHLIFSLHWHAFVFVAGSIFILLVQWFDTNYLYYVLFIVVVCYGWLMYRRVMRDGGFRLFIKGSLLHYFYLWMVFWASIGELLWVIWRI